MKEVKHHAPYSAKSSPLFSTSLPRRSSGLVVVVEMVMVVEMMVVMVKMVVLVKNKTMVAIRIV